MAPKAIMPDHGQVERMSRIIKDATVKRYHYTSHDELRHHLHLFVDAYNYGRRLKTLRSLTPYGFICQTWTKEPERFRLDPSHQTARPYTYSPGACAYRGLTRAASRPREVGRATCP